MVYIPAEPAQFAARVLGNSDSFYYGRHVATSVQTVCEDSQTSEGELTLVEGAADAANDVNEGGKNHHSHLLLKMHYRLCLPAAKLKLPQPLRLYHCVGMLS